MAITAYMYVFITVLFVVVLKINDVNCWSTETHQAIGMVAMSVITSQTSTQIKRLLGGKDIVDVSAWEERLLKYYSSFKPLHYLYQNNTEINLSENKNDTLAKCKVFELSEKTCPQNHCIVRVLQHFYGRFMGKPKLIPLEFPVQITFTDADALKYLIILLGDLHQPLHLGLLEDNGGKNISLTHREMTGVSSETSLFQFWESVLVQYMIQHNPSSWYGGWTHANSLGKDLVRLREEWTKQPDDKKHNLFETWAKESLEQACKLIYIDPTTGKKISDEYKPTPAYDFNAFQVIRKQILIAGVRIGLVLDRIFLNRDAAQLRQGTSLNFLLENASIPQKLSSQNQQYFRSFCINLCIIGAVLSVFLYVLRFYSVQAVEQKTTNFWPQTAQHKPPKREE